ncbi:thioredoxin [Candidatus Shapirobacteria bacterium CG03_land_8_20_14_0_80_39_12]|uniref:Thioredoxin n=1 Tax=Candidatus Shapirobacteria bacterium CG03_land_8_20_14_0_80_39_12 TaxID=1974879 RepID=A0A2M7BG78_9BACT|nr:MAG: thioredoxin [Candidatus Shapirobacteria bacterium CG03_land_8_20_14_0_80_39_12]
MPTLNVTDSDFDAQVLKSSLPVLVDFWAPWCSPCKIAGPILEEISEEYKDKLVIAKVNVDENNQMPTKYSVMSIPTVILFKGGQEVGRQTGFSGKEAYLELISKGGDI